MRSLRGHILVAAAVLTSTACRSSDGSAENNIAEPRNEGSAKVLPVPDPALNREELLLAVMRTASAAATGTDDIKIQRQLDGKLFRIGLRFGCPATTGGPAAVAASQRGDQEEALRLSVRTSVALDDPAIVAIGADRAFEAVDGFWIERPWLFTPSCPASAPAPAEPASPEDDEPAQEQPRAKRTEADTSGPAPAPAPLPRIAISQFYSNTDTRAGRRTDRPYETAVGQETKIAIERSGFTLVLSGRLRALPTGRVITCPVLDPQRPPDCIISADFDQVRMENPVSGAVLAQWAD